MADPLDRLKTALADRYAVQRELGSDIFSLGKAARRVLVSSWTM